MADSTHLLMRMLNRGDRFALERGRLVVMPASGIEVPAEWYSANRIKLTAEIVRLTSIDAFRYDNFTTGRYGKHKAQGITLHYVSLLGDDSPRITFNAKLTRAKTSKHGRRGDPLPAKQFRVGRRYRFTKYWHSEYSLRNRSSDCSLISTMPPKTPS